MVKQTDSPSSTWKKHMTIIRDVVFIILFLASVVGWIRSETNKKAELKYQVEALSIKVNDLATQIEKQSQIISEQLVLNGKVIQYLDTHK